MSSMASGSRCSDHQSLDSNIIDLTEIISVDQLAARQDTSDAVSVNQDRSPTKSTPEAKRRKKTEHALSDTNFSLSPLIEIDSNDDSGDEQHDSAGSQGNAQTFQYAGSARTKIVGIQHYRGSVNINEHAFIRREPSNAYDRNAIQVLNINRQQVGHIPKDFAAGLAPWLDSDILKAEGSIAGKRGVYTIPLRLDVFTTPSVLQQIVPALARAGIQLVNDRSRARVLQGDGVGIPEVPYGTGSSSVITTRQATAFLDELTSTARELENMPMAEQPSRLRTQLLDYQLQGLHWLRSQENPRSPTSNDITQLWKKHGDGYLNLASHFSSPTIPSFGHGGLLADDMGLGKTLQMLALIVGSESLRRNSNTASSPTLVVCPRGLISNWLEQAIEHVDRDHPLRCTQYHGKIRPSKRELERYELVVTTYGTVVAEHQRPANASAGLFDTIWARIILDEAHKVRNPRARTTLAIHALQGRANWCLTGTPVVNTYNDLGSIVRFVRWTGGIEDAEVFNSKITRKLLSPGQLVRSEAVKLIQIMMQNLALRRRKNMIYKGKQLIELPLLTEYCHKIAFNSSEEASTYDKLSKQARGLLKSPDSTTQVLEILLRMRQACCSLDLISTSRLELLDKLSAHETVDMTPGMQLLLRNLLALSVEACEDCPICFEALSDENKIPVITYCKHIFCKDCIQGSIADSPRCPLCRASLTNAQITEQATERPVSRSGTRSGASSKISALLEIIKTRTQADRKSKTIVFSQWTSFLNLIEPHLRSSSLKYTRLDGTMSNSARDASIKELRSDPSCVVMLASLGVASVGLNLVMADQVIICDPWWAPAIEDQAVDRVYRLGQTRPVTVYKLVMEGTVEEKVLEIQEKKRKLIATIGAGNERPVVQTRRNDLMTLLGDE